MSRPRRKTAVCPICGRPREETFKPFCSKHCADVDLARWLDGRYAIPERENGNDDTESPPGPRDEEV